MNETEFINFIETRPSSPVWKKIAYIQTILKVRAGIGETIQHTYFSHDANDVKAIEELELAVSSDVEYDH